MENPKTPAVRGWRTFLQATFASVIGLLAAIWNVPGVPEAITLYAQENWLPLLLTFIATIGAPAGLISYIQNRLEASR